MSWHMKLFDEKFIRFTCYVNKLMLAPRAHLDEDLK